jgi:hypothetical protein
VILQMVQPLCNPAPRHVTVLIASHISCRAPAFPCTTSRCVAQTTARSGRPPFSLQSLIERPISALLLSLQQLGWRRAPYKGCPRKSERPSAGTRAKIIHVGLEGQKKTSADILSFPVTFLSPAVFVVRPKLKNNRKGRRLVR